MTAAPARRGRRPKGSGDARAALLRAALSEFGRSGLDATTMRAIAGRAGVNPALAYHYFEDKHALFVEAVGHMMRPPSDGLPNLLADPRRAGPAIVRLFLTRWEGSEESMALSGLLRSALTDGEAARALATVIQRQVAPSVAAVVGVRAADRRVALIASTLLGLGLARDVLRLPGLTAASIGEVAREVGPTISRYLAGPAAGSAYGMARRVGGAGAERPVRVRRSRGGAVARAPPPRGST